MLERTYGRPRLGNPEDPLDDLIRIIVSNKTAPQVAERIYQRLKTEFPTWQDLVDRGPSALKSILRPGGLAAVRSQQVYSALAKIADDFGTCELTALGQWPIADAQKYLTSLPGVSDKVAKCVLMYTMNGQVLPVDSHVYRVSKRLGWTARSRADQCHQELEALVPPRRRYAFHVDCVAHGRVVCRPKHPRCDRCSLQQNCDFYQRTDGKQ